MCGGDAGAIFKWLLGDVECKNVDESTLLEWSDRHRILLYPFIPAKDKKHLSPEFLEQCKSLYLQNVERISYVHHFLKKFNEFLSINSLHAIVLKGVPLAEIYYPNKFTRHSRDVDLLVEQHKINLVADWLKLEGFHLNTDYYLYNKKQQEIFIQHNHHFCFHGTNPIYPLIIELHWKLRPSDDICNISPFENGYSCLRTSYDQLFTLNHIDQFIYLCVHGTEHGWYRLKWLLDLPFLFQKVNLEWNSVRARADELNALEHVKLSLYLIFHFTGKILMPGIEIDSFDSYLKIKGSKLVCRINNPALVETGYMSAFRQILFLSSFNGRKWSSNFWMKWWISPSDWKSFPLPNYLFFLYYPMRPLFWFIRKSFR